MEYRSLRELYYADRANYEAIYQQRFFSEYAQHIDFSIGDAPAFFVVTPEIQRLMLRIQKVDKKVLACCEQLPEEAIEQFTRRCLIDEIVLTNDIEGVYSTRREIGGILVELGKNDRHRRFRGLVQKYAMLRLGENLALNTCQDIRRVYDDLALREVVEDCPTNAPDGKIFRKDSVSVRSVTQKELHRGLYPEEAIIGAMEQALDYLNDGSVELLYRVAAFHYLLGYIHPFYDGNGRLNRFVSSYLLSTELQPILSYRLSYTIKENITRYYDAFKVCNDPRDRGDLTPFITMFLEVIDRSVQQLLDALERRAKRLEHYNQGIIYLPRADESDFYGLYALLIQAELFSEVGISTQALLGKLELSRATLRKRLAVIDGEGLLKTQPYGREKHYGIDLDALEELSQGRA